MSRTDLKTSTRPETRLLPQSRRRIIARTIGVLIALFLISKIYSWWTAPYDDIFDEFESYEESESDW